ncbi:hypothetical protein SNEBB_006929 [Seison nebaliae]|nr:hypothetical protein SNEBB_006929 [Seison nebaliae]
MSLSFDIILKIQLDNESVFDDSIRKLLLEDVKNRGGIDVFGNVQIENVNKLQKNIFLKLNENYSKYIKINEQRNISLEIEGPSFNNEVERGKFLEFWPDVSSFGEMSDGRLIELIELTSVIGKSYCENSIDNG